MEVERDYPPATTWLSPTSDILYFGRQSRDLHRYDVCRADTTTGETKVVIEEVLNTYVEVQPLRLVNGGQELVWWSERDGWGHYYLYEGSGKLIRQLTSGEFTDPGRPGSRREGPRPLFHRLRPGAERRPVFHAPVQRRPRRPGGEAPQPRRRQPFRGA